MRSFATPVPFAFLLITVHGQQPATYELTTPDSLYRQVTMDLGGGNTCYAFERMFNWDSTHVELLWTDADGSITNATAYHLSSPYFHLSDAVHLDDGILMNGWITGMEPLNPVLLKVDDLGNVQWHKRISPVYHQGVGRGMIIPHGAAFTAYTSGAGPGYYGFARLEGESTGSSWSGVYMIPPTNIQYELYGAMATADPLVHLVFGTGVDLDDPNLPNFKTVLIEARDTGATWMKMYSMPPVHTHPNQPLDVQATMDGNYICSGTFRMDWDDDRGYVMKLDPDGDVLWCLTYADTSGVLQLTGMTELPGGDLLVAGQDAGYQCLLMRLSPVGEIIWQRRLQQPGSYWHPVGRFFMSATGGLELEMQGRRIGLNTDGDGCDFAAINSIADSIHVPVVTSVQLTNSSFTPTTDPLENASRTPVLAWQQTCLFNTITDSGDLPMPLRAFPIPAEDHVFLEGIGSKERVVLRAINGRLLYDGPYNGAVDLRTRAAGAYTIEVPARRQRMLVVKR